MKAQLQIGNEMREGKFITHFEADDGGYHGSFYCTPKVGEFFPPQFVLSTFESKEMAVSAFKSIGGIILGDAE